MAKRKAVKDVTHVTQEFSSSVLASSNEKSVFAGYRFGFVVIMESGDDPEAVERLLEKTETSIWAWEMMQSIYQFYRREEWPFPKQLQQWVDDVVFGRRKKPKRKRGRNVDEGQDQYMLTMMDLAECWDLTQEQFALEMQFAKGTNSHTVLSQLRRAKAREKSGAIWGRPAATGRSHK